MNLKIYQLTTYFADEDPDPTAPGVYPIDIAIVIAENPDRARELVKIETQVDEEFVYELWDDAEAVIVGYPHESITEEKVLATQ